MTKCKKCGDEFEKNRKWQIFCSASCRSTYWDKKHPRVSFEDAKLIKMHKLLK